MDLIFAGIMLLVFLPHVFPVTLELERAAPRGGVNFSSQGFADPHETGFYFTKLKIGTPPKDFNLIIDTGSDLTWIFCEPCDGCPTLNRFGIPHSSYSYQNSSSASRIFCSDSICRTTGLTCSSDNPVCFFSMLYEDDSKSFGYLVEDVFHFETTVNGSRTTHSSASVGFGCSKYYRPGRVPSDNTVDGILGLGPLGDSIISQLSSRGLIPKVFSHCLRRDSGGILVLGEILHPGIIYSPLVPSEPNYNLNLQSIAIGGKIVHIDPKVFALGGTLIDSGIKPAVLAAKAYDPFVDFLIAAVSRSAQPVFTGSNLCFQVSEGNKVHEIFPAVSFNFEGGASMVARPKDYLIFQSLDNDTPWCFGFQKGKDRTILGDLVLRDRIVIYDLANLRLGWADYDCSQPVNVSSSTTDNVNTRHHNGSSSTLYALSESVIACIATLLVYISMVSCI